MRRESDRQRIKALKPYAFVMAPQSGVFALPAMFAVFPQTRLPSNKSVEEIGRQHQVAQIASGQFRLPNIFDPVCNETVCRPKPAAMK
jgi:hypothetical protein